MSSSLTKRNMLAVNVSILVVILVETISTGAQENPVLKIQQGVLRGKYMTSRRGRIYAGFTGIPYAKPPVDDLRFQPPVPADPWEGEYDATKSHNVCPQESGDDAIGSEDCLYLNVYTPQISKATRLLPVIVFIHGGFFMKGDNNQDTYGSEILLDKDIVLVTPNYRLGTLGFFTTGDLVVPGNNGLKDQNLALKWIRHNIAAFGGDPEKITLQGQSAGGVSVAHHMVSPLSKDLIRGVIAMSGSSVSHWAVHRNDDGVKNSKKLAELLHCPTSDSSAMVRCMRTVEALDIVKQGPKFTQWAIDPPRPFKPVIEPPHSGAFLAECPEDIIKSGRAADVPLMVGGTTEDGGGRVSTYFKNASWMEDFDKDFNSVIPISFEYAYQENKDAISDSIRDFYFGDKKIGFNSGEELTKVYTDVYYIEGVTKLAKMVSRYGSQPVYQYLFGYQGSETHCEYPDGSARRFGVCHEDDLFYLFTMKADFPDYEPTERDERMMDVLTTLHANFAETGNPTPREGGKWSAVETDEYLLVGDDLKMQHGLYSERMRFLEELRMHSGRCMK